MDDDLAYDGSNRPQERDLTARERDVLCRILYDVLRPAVDFQNNTGQMVIPSSIYDSVPIRVGEISFLQIINTIIKVINPRES